MKYRLILSLIILSVILANIPALAQDTSNTTGALPDPIAVFPDTHQNANKIIQKEKSGHIIPEKVQTAKEKCSLKRNNDKLQKSNSHYRDKEDCPEDIILPENKK